MVSATPYDVVLLDEMMPGMGGLATLAAIKDRYPTLPVILITKSEEEEIMDEAIGRHITDYLIKPVNPSQIWLACKKVFDARRCQDRARARLRRRRARSPTSTPKRLDWQRVARRQPAARAVGRRARDDRRAGAQAGAHGHPARSSTSTSARFVEEQLSALGASAGA